MDDGAPGSGERLMGTKRTCLAKGKHKLPSWRTPIILIYPFPIDDIGVSGDSYPRLRRLNSLGIISAHQVGAPHAFLARISPLEFIDLFGPMQSH